MKHPLRDWLEFAGLTAATWIIRHLSFRTLRPLADLIGSIVYWCDPRGRLTAHQNIEAAFPGKFSPARKCWIARGSYRNFARTMFELFWAPNLSMEFFREHIVFDDWDRDPCAESSTKSVVNCCMHFSNFEWISLLGAFSITRGPLIAQNLKNKFLGPIFNQLRSSTGSTVIPQERAMLKMFKHLKSGGKFGMLIDLNIDPRQSAVPVTTFGGLIVSVTSTHVALAQRTGAVIAPLECRPLPDGRYRMIQHAPIKCPPEADPAELAQKCWDVLEPGIHAHPECWLWSYKHWRYKPRENHERYPAYASFSDRFDELLESHQHSGA